MGRIRNTFDKLGADAHSLDPCRICRIPGSINAKVGRKVSYMPWYDVSGTIRTYKLRELAGAFGIDPERVPPQPPPAMVSPPPIQYIAAAPPAEPSPLRVEGPSPRQPSPCATTTNPTKNPAKSKAGTKGWVKRWQNELARFYTLLRLRGGCNQGQRNAAVLVLATLAQKLNRDNPQAVYEECTRNLFPLLEQGREPYTIDQVVATVRSVFAKKPPVDEAGIVRHVSQVWISNTLAITPDESKQVNWPCATVYGGPSPKPELSGAAARIRDRREKIMAIVAANSGDVPTIRPLCARLQELGTPACSYATVREDLEALAKAGLIRLNRKRAETNPTLPGLE